MKMTAYYPALRGSMILLAAAATAMCADTGPLRVGASRVEYTQITAALDTPPTGKYAHEKLYVRAIVLDNGATRAALISVDGNTTDTMHAKVAAELKIPIANVIASSTHSHSAARVPPSIQRVIPPALDDLTLQAVREAVAKLQPARMAFGAGLSYLNVNRDTINPKTRLWTQDANMTAPSDKTVAVLKFETPAGEPIAMYVNYAMHPVNLYLSGIVSADYPGAASRYIEQIYDDKAVVAFTNGAEGDQNPLYLRASTAAMFERGGEKYTGQPLVREATESEIREERRPMKPLSAKGADALSKFVEAEGIIFAEEVLRVAQNLNVTVGEVRISGAEKTITCPGRTRTNKGREGEPGTYKDGPDVKIVVGVLGVGNVALGRSQGEVYNAIGQGFKAKSPMANSVFVGMANGRPNSGYIPTDEAFGHNTFQVVGSALKQGCADAAIQNTLAELATQYMNGQTGTK